MGLAKEEEELITCAYHNSVVPRLAARFKLPDRRERGEQSYTLIASGRLHSMQDLLHIAEWAISMFHILQAGNFY